MNGPTENNGLLARLRANETLQKLSRGRPDLIIFGAPVALIALIAAIAVVVVAMAGGGGSDEQVVGSPTAPATSPTADPQALPTGSAGLLTPIAVSPGDQLTHADLAARGAGPAGRGEFNGDRLIIPSVGIDAPFSIKTVPNNGQMPNPNGPTDVAWYDFSGFPNLGGAPGKGGNVILAGHVDYIHYGPAVFWDVRKLKIGDEIDIRMKDGSTATYKVEFNKQMPADGGGILWEEIVAGTAQESVTLITCTGAFEAGHYSDRQIIWGRRVA